MKKGMSCSVCDYVPVNLAGWWTFMPFICCQANKARRITHRKKNR